MASVYIKSISDVLKKMEFLGSPYFKITESDGKGLLGENDEDIPVPEAMVLLEDSLRQLEGTVRVVLTEEFKQKSDGQRTGSGKASHSFLLRLGNETKSVNGSDPSPMNNTIMGLMQQNYSLQLDAIKKEFETNAKLEELKRSLKNDAAPDSGLTVLLDTLRPYIPAIMQKLSMAPTPGYTSLAVAGVNDQEIDTIQKNDNMNSITPDLEIRLNNALAQLIKVDKNTVETIESLATFATQQPEQYLAFIPILKSQIK